MAIKCVFQLIVFLHLLTFGFVESKNECIFSGNVLVPFNKDVINGQRPCKYTLLGTNNQNHVDSFQIDVICDEKTKEISIVVTALRKKIQLNASNVTVDQILQKRDVSILIPPLRIDVIQNGASKKLSLNTGISVTYVPRGRGKVIVFDNYTGTNDLGGACGNPWTTGQRNQHFNRRRLLRFIKEKPIYPTKYTSHRSANGKPSFKNRRNFLKRQNGARNPQINPNNSYGDRNRFKERKNFYPNCFSGGFWRTNGSIWMAVDCSMIFACKNSFVTHSKNQGCSQFADCVNIRQVGICRCKPGFIGNGLICVYPQDNAVSNYHPDIDHSGLITPMSSANRPGATVAYDLRPNIKDSPTYSNWINQGPMPSFNDPWDYRNRIGNKTWRPSKTRPYQNPETPRRGELEKQTRPGSFQLNVPPHFPGVRRNSNINNLLGFPALVVGDRKRPLVKSAPNGPQQPRTQPGTMRSGHNRPRDLYNKNGRGPYQPGNNPMDPFNKNGGGPYQHGNNPMDPFNKNGGGPYQPGNNPMDPFNKNGGGPYQHGNNPMDPFNKNGGGPYQPGNNPMDPFNKNGKGPYQPGNNPRDPFNKNGKGPYQPGNNPRDPFNKNGKGHYQPGNNPRDPFNKNGKGPYQPGNNPMDPFNKNGMGPYQPGNNPMDPFKKNGGGPYQPGNNPNKNIINPLKGGRKNFPNNRGYPGTQDKNTIPRNNTFRVYPMAYPGYSKPHQRYISCRKDSKRMICKLIKDPHKNGKTVPILDPSIPNPAFGKVVPVLDPSNPNPAFGKAVPVLDPSNPNPALGKAVPILDPLNPNPAFGKNMPVLNPLNPNPAFGQAVPGRDPSNPNPAFGQAVPGLDPSNPNPAFGQAVPGLDPSNPNPAFGQAVPGLDPSNPNPAFSQAVPGLDPSNPNPAFGKMVPVLDPSNPNPAFGQAVPGLDPSNPNPAFGQAVPGLDSSNPYPAFGKMAPVLDPSNPNPAFGQAVPGLDPSNPNPAFGQAVPGLDSSNPNPALSKTVPVLDPSNPNPVFGKGQTSPLGNIPNKFLPHGKNNPRTNPSGLPNNGDNLSRNLGNDILNPETHGYPYKFPTPGSPLRKGTRNHSPDNEDPLSRTLNNPRRTDPRSDQPNFINTQDHKPPYLNRPGYKHPAESGLTAIPRHVPGGLNEPITKLHAIGEWTVVPIYSTLFPPTNVRGNTFATPKGDHTPTVSSFIDSVSKKIRNNHFHYPTSVTPGIQQFGTFTTVYTSVKQPLSNANRPVSSNVNYPSRKGDSSIPSVKSHKRKKHPKNNSIINKHRYPTADGTIDGFLVDPSAKWPLDRPGLKQKHGNYNIPKVKHILPKYGMRHRNKGSSKKKPKRPLKNRHRTTSKIDSLNNKRCRLTGYGCRKMKNATGKNRTLIPRKNHDRLSPFTGSIGLGNNQATTATMTTTLYSTSKTMTTTIEEPKFIKDGDTENRKPHQPITNPDKEYKTPRKNSNVQKPFLSGDQPVGNEDEHEKCKGVTTGLRYKIMKKVKQSVEQIES